MDKILDENCVNSETDTHTVRGGTVECLLCCENSWISEDKLSTSVAKMTPSYWSSHSKINEIIKIEDIQDTDESCCSDTKQKTDHIVEKWARPVVKVKSEDDIEISDDFSKKINGESFPIKTNGISHKSYPTENPDLISSNYISHKHLKFKCVKCKLNFDSYNSLQLHINSPLPCVDTVTHSRTSKNYDSDNTFAKEYKCKVCNQYFSLMKDLDDHMILHSVGKNEFNRCKVCNQRFSLMKDLDDHMILHAIEDRFNEKETDISISEGSPLEMLQAISDKSFICHICGRGFSDDDNLQMHILLHNGLKSFVCPLCNKSFSDESLYTKHKLGHKLRGSTSTSSLSIPSTDSTWTQNREKPFRCLTCGKEFAHRYYLTNHERIHQGEKPFVCELCDERFPSISRLEKHCILHDKPFLCEMCYQRFPFRSELQQHTATEHSVDRTYACEICNKSFSRNENLKIHKASHGDSSQRAIVTERINSDDDLDALNCEDEQLKCSICCKEFSSFASLHVHERNHVCPRRKVYKCEICLKSFVKRCDLKRHLMTHTGERPFQCDTCQKSFTRNSHLKTHKMLHTGEKPYKCSICNKGYTKRSDMRRHFSTHVVQQPSKPEIIVL